jgi:hypothetical protein
MAACQRHKMKAQSSMAVLKHQGINIKVRAVNCKTTKSLPTLE